MSAVRTARRCLFGAGVAATLASATAAAAQEQLNEAAAEESFDACAVLEKEPAPIPSGPEPSDAEIKQLRSAAFARAQYDEQCYRQQIKEELAAAKDEKERRRLSEVLPKGGTTRRVRVFAGERVRGVPFQVEIVYHPDLAAGTLINSGSTRSRQNSIRTALTGRAPWDWKHLCGGILIEPNLVLTAAHCATEAQFNFGSGIVARLGAEDLANPKSLFVKIDRVVRHANYNQERPGGLYADDIALMHIVPYAPSSRISPITPNRNPALDFKSRDRKVTGWGKSGEGTRTAQFLQQINVNVLTTEECRANRIKNGENEVATKVHDKVLCASGLGVKSCEGDSGGPLFGGNATPLLYGIVSWNRGECRKGTTLYPGGYTRVSRYTDWIARAKEALKRGAGFQYLR